MIGCLIPPNWMKGPLIAVPGAPVPLLPTAFGDDKTAAVFTPPALATALGFCAEIYKKNRKINHSVNQTFLSLKRKQ